MTAIPLQAPDASGPPSPRRPRLARWGLRAGAAVVALGVLGVAALAVLWPLTPSVSDVEGRIAARLHSFGATDPQALPRPDRVGVAVIATENSRFYSDHGIDVLGALRAGVGFLHGAADPGGATLEQQLAKNLYTPTSSGPVAKLEQVELALKLNAAYPKTRILEMYLSAVYFGHGYYGLPAAARGYFGVAPNALSWAQASLLAGLVQAPTAYDPYVHPDLAKQRQRHVLDRLVATGALTPGQADAAFAAPWRLRTS